MGEIVASTWNVADQRPTTPCSCVADLRALTTLRDQEALFSLGAINQGALDMVRRSSLGKTLGGEPCSLISQRPLSAIYRR